MTTPIKSYNILHLHGPQDVSSKMEFHLNLVIQRAGIKPSWIRRLNMHNEVKGLVYTKKAGNRITWHVNKERMPEVRQKVDHYIDRVKPDIVVCTDIAALRLFSFDIESLAKCRGSLYNHVTKSGRKVRVIVTDDIYRMVDTFHGKFVALNDWQKIARFLKGEQRQEPRFSYTVCHTRADVDEFKSFMSQSFIKTNDLETSGDWIQCIGYTGIVQGKMHSWVIPFYNPTKAGGCHWDDPRDEIYAWQAVKEVNDNDAFAIFQNGSYDNSYNIKYRIPMRNYFVDTQHLWHCMFCELPKRIDFIASIVVDHYTFWKEESKGDKEAKTNQFSQDNLDRFWRYCAMDCHYTTLSAFQCVQMVLNLEWAVVNYESQLTLQIGPALAMMCRGLLIDKQEWNKQRNEWQEKYNIALHKLRTMVADHEFNPASHEQVKWLFYKLLGAKEIKVGKSTGGSDEMTLKRIGEQHVLFRMFADAVIGVREPAKVLSTYVNIFQRGRRLRYTMNTAATETARFGSGTWMWEGLNAQTIPDHLRGRVVADDGWLLFDIDLEQSDARFVAYESQDQTYIRNVESGKDTHCLHAAHFFKEPYEVIYKAVKEGVERYAHKVTGIRSVTKKIVHGANYRMMAQTLYNTMVKDLGREAVLAAIKAAFNIDASRLAQSEIIHYLSIILEDYHVLYPRLHEWHREIEEILAQNRRLTTAFGWTRIFFGPSTDQGVQRDATAFLGQGDTAGCINRALRYIYYGATNVKFCEGSAPSQDGTNLNSVSFPALDGRDIKVLLQVHDSLVGIVRCTKVSLLAPILDMLELPVHIQGRWMRVPASCAIGFRWGDKNLTKVTRQELSDGTWKNKFLEDQKGKVRHDTLEQLQRSLSSDVRYRNDRLIAGN